MAPSRSFVGRGVAALGVGFLAFTTLASCADRLEPPVPEQHAQVDNMKQWATERAEPYHIPERALQAYAYAAYAVEQEQGCAVGWQTLAALGDVLTQHGQVNSTTIDEDGVTSKPIRAVAPAAGGKKSVPDTDGGDIDGDSTKDIPVGPMQLMPSRWEQYGTAAEPGNTPNPDNIDDAALTTAKITCSAGDLTSPEGWTTAVSEFNPSPVFLKAVHKKAKEYSR